MSNLCRTPVRLFIFFGALSASPSEFPRGMLEATKRALTTANESPDYSGIKSGTHRLLIRDAVRHPKLLPADDPLTMLTEVGEENTSMSCDAAFFRCIGSDQCNDCFYQMKTNEINWAGVTGDTECNTVVATLQKGNLCASLGTSGEDRDLFCETFHACVYFETEDEDIINCDDLTECDWPGIHTSFLGDGVCHDSYVNACYNHEICGYDQGDCCEDTCVTTQFSYLECGSDGFACRDPNSTTCNPTLSLACPPSSYDNPDTDTPIPECSDEQSLYRLVMYDSFGDGWEDTKIKITPKSEASTVQDPVYEGGLESGAEGTAFLCLSINPMCYSVEVGGGVWGREASWFVHPYSEGAPAIASGGGSMSCEFTVAGGDCETTCKGNSNTDPTSDSDYKDFKKMYKCIDEKCMIQASECRADAACMKCFQEDVPDYCFSIDSFLAVTDCSMCSCTGMEGNEFCDNKAAPGLVPVSPKNGGKELEPNRCTPAETLAGGSAVLEFGECFDYSKTSIMMTEFNTNNFGAIDEFESCSHGFHDNEDHAGSTAMKCMKILFDAREPDSSSTGPVGAIAALANSLYSDGESFCDCAKKGSEDAPLCPDFYNFKTLLYEAIDACIALDQIDCAAWDQFQSSCKVSMMDTFGSVTFDEDQCEYIQSGQCNTDTVVFPSFRRLDCADELPVGAWDFYTQYSKFCVNGATPESPQATPTDSQSVQTKPPTPYQPIKPSAIGPTGPSPSYTPPHENKRPTYKSPDEKVKSHWFRNFFFVCVIGGLGYYMYKKRMSDGFSFVRYRRVTNFGLGNNAMDDGDMYSGLALESSTNFEPPTLPPAPMSMPANGGYGA